MPTYEQYKACGKVIKGKEVWCLAQEWSDHTDGKPVRISPVHFIATMQTRVRGPLHDSLITLQMRDDYLARYMSALNSMTEHDAVQIMGETLLDLQEVNIDTPGTSFEGRARRWFEADFEGRWREAFRRQQRICKEREECKKIREEEAKKAREAREREEAARGRKGDRGGKGREPYGGGKGAVLLV